MSAQALKEELRLLRWATAATRSARRQLRRTPVGEIVLAPPPAVSTRAGMTVEPTLRFVLARNCLVRSLVRQVWHGARGHRRDLVIGVRSPRTRFRAHAWLDGDPDVTTSGFTELTRFPCR